MSRFAGGRASETVNAAGEEVQERGDAGIVAGGVEGGGGGKRDGEGGQMIFESDDTGFGEAFPGL